MLTVAVFRFHGTLSADHINHNYVRSVIVETATLLARFMGPTWGPSGDDRTQVGPMLAPWTLLSGYTYRYVHILLLSKSGYQQMELTPWAILLTRIYLDPSMDK